MNRQAPRASKTAVQGTGIAVGFLLLIALILAVCPLIVMWGTGVLHDAQPSIPALSFWQSVVACIIGRALTSTGTASR